LKGVALKILENLPGTANEWLEAACGSQVISALVAARPLMITNCRWHSEAKSVLCGPQSSLEAIS